MAKVNSLCDVDIIRALYAASQQGVTIRLNVRGICTLVPGVDGLSENIQVVSILGRFLEHARILYCFNGGAEEIYCSSADWMPRNLERRVEILFPIDRPELRRRVRQILEALFDDTTHAYDLQPSGIYHALRPPNDTDNAFHAQAHFCDLVTNADHPDEPHEQEFKVRRRPPAE